MAALAASIDSVLGERPSTPGEEASRDEGVLGVSRPSTSYSAGGGAAAAAAAAAGEGGGVKGREVEVLLLDTWGDKNYVGLTGLELVAAGGEVVAVTDAQLTAAPRDLNEIPGNRLVLKREGVREKSEKVSEKEEREPKP